MNNLLWRDDYISVFVDDEKYLLVFVNDRGQTKVINYDDNFYSVEENILAYSNLIKHSTNDKHEQLHYLNAFINYTKSEIEKGGQELDYDYLQHCGVYQ